MNLPQCVQEEIDMLPAEFTGQMAIVWWASGVTRIETSRTGNLERLGPFLVGPLRVQQYIYDELEKNAMGIRREYGPLDQALTHASEPLARLRSTRGLGSERHRAFRLSSEDSGGDRSRGPR